MDVRLSIPQRKPVGHLGRNKVRVPARIAGIDDRVGSLEPGKDADLVIWSGDPLDVLSRVERALIGGAEVYTAGADPEWAEPG